MASGANPKAVVVRRVLALFATLAVVLAVAACKSYVFLPVDVAYEKFSPPYVVNFVNLTGTAFEVLPSSYGTGKDQKKVRVEPGASFQAILQLRRFTVGPGSSVPGAEVVDGPYFEQGGADMARIRFAQTQVNSMLIRLTHPSWFDEYERPAAAPLELAVPLNDFSLVPLFPLGPRGGP